MNFVERLENYISIIFILWLRFIVKAIYCIRVKLIQSRSRILAMGFIGIFVETLQRPQHA